MLITEGLRFRYRPRSVELFGGLHHEFFPGTITAVTGPSGSGKSTLLYLLGLLLMPTSGRIVLGGSAVGQLSDLHRSRIRASTIGFVFQDAMLDSNRSVLDNVCEGALYTNTSRRATRKRALDLMDELGVLFPDKHLPGEVSGGQAQRIGLCRALVKRPSIILADEPTGNLDSVSAEIVLDRLVQAASEGTTVIVSSHDRAVAERADDVVPIE